MVDLMAKVAQPHNQNLSNLPIQAFFSRMSRQIKTWLLFVVLLLLEQHCFHLSFLWGNWTNSQESTCGKMGRFEKTIIIKETSYWMLQ